jgi:hypothetical protein
MRRTSQGQDLRPDDWGGAPLAEHEGKPLVRLLSHDGTLLGLAEPAKTPGFLHPTVVFPQSAAAQRAP